jgi:hypothetical protein
VEAAVKILKWLAAAVAVLAVAFVGGAYLLPREAAVERSIIVRAPPERVFPHLNDLRKFTAWSPWARMDPETRYSYTGPEQGLGQQMSWESARLGKGSMAIAESVENRRVATVLDLGGAGAARASFDLAPLGGGTAVTWGFKTDLGKNPVKRWMGLMFARWIGADYEQGLKNLKETVEKEGG